VIEPSADERQAVAAIAFDEAEYLASIGEQTSVGEAGNSLIERNWLRPTLEFNGIYGGYAGPGKKTVIPSSAGAKITCRLVPDQNPVEITECVVRHLRQGVGRDARLSIHVGATVPIGGLFKRLLAIDTVFFSFATADEDYHAPNEFFRLSSLDTGLKAWTQYLRALGRQPCGPSRRTTGVG
jgi:acetylornithine deacetylase/succinyl-diaminopimelate desuccinylase-like protein